MRRMFWAFVFSVALLAVSGCAGLQVKEKIVEGNHYIDPNHPVIDVYFPFDVSVFDERTEHLDDSSVLVKTTILKVPRIYDAALISKVRLPWQQYYWTGANVERIENLLYCDKRDDNSGAYVYYIKSDGYHYLVGDVLQYFDERNMYKITIVEKLFNVYNVEDVKKDKKKSIDRMVENVAFVFSKLKE